MFGMGRTAGRRSRLSFTPSVPRHALCAPASVASSTRKSPLSSQRMSRKHSPANNAWVCTNKPVNALNNEGQVEQRTNRPGAFNALDKHIGQRTVVPRPLRRVCQQQAAAVSAQQLGRDRGHGLHAEGLVEAVADEHDVERRERHRGAPVKALGAHAAGSCRGRRWRCGRRCCCRWCYCCCCVYCSRCCRTSTMLLPLRPYQPLMLRQPLRVFRAQMRQQLF